MPLIDYAQVLNELADDISNTSESKGFWDPDDVGDMGIIPLKIALIHDECSEALQVHRKEYDDAEEDIVSRMTPMQEDDFAEEIADVIIRSLDLAGYYDWDIGTIIVDKMAKNEGRPYRHGKRY